MPNTATGTGLVASALVSLLVAACTTATPGASPTAAAPAAHDPATLAVLATLNQELGVEFEPAGPHHQVGRAPDGVELDLIGMPVEQAVLSVPAGQPGAGYSYLAHLRDLLHGPARVYDWVADGLNCRSTPDGTCETSFSQGNIAARFSDGGPGYVVVSISRRP
ncbi:MAG TPA: hypothetical protein VK838_04950 [Candidatus Limnocylindrales bacterium]|nr:hypothetical protein [Candidatus Limnocylindrales bacterium]